MVKDIEGFSLVFAGLYIHYHTRTTISVKNSQIQILVRIKACTAQETYPRLIKRDDILVVVIRIIIGQGLPAVSFWDAQDAYDRILGYTPRLLIASLVAFLFGEFANSYVLSRMKIATKGRWLWTRTIGSTIVGQGLDSVIFIFLAFWGTSPQDALLSAMVTQWLFKVAYEAAATPLTYVVVNFIKRQEGIDTNDRDTSFNPLSLAE